jgi:hypothetical protein
MSAHVVLVRVQEAAGLSVVYIPRMRKRLFDGKMPLPLRIVAWLIIIQGVFSFVASLIQTNAAGAGLSPEGFAPVAVDVANGVVCTIVGVGTLFRRRCWRALAALLVGGNCGMQLAEIAATSGAGLFLFPQSIILVISFGISGLMLWALTDRRAHLAMAR